MNANNTARGVNTVYVLEDKASLVTRQDSLKESGTLNCLLRLELQLFDLP